MVSMLIEGQKRVFVGPIVAVKGNTMPVLPMGVRCTLTVPPKDIKLLLRNIEKLHTFGEQQ